MILPEDRLDLAIEQVGVERGDWAVPGARREGERLGHRAFEELVVERLAAVTGTCTAQLDTPVTGELGVSLDGRDIEPCTEERCDSGFVFDATHDTVEIQGADCLAVQDGACHDLRFFEA